MRSALVALFHLFLIILWDSIPIPISVKTGNLNMDEECFLMRTPPFPGHDNCRFAQKCGVAGWDAKMTYSFFFFFFYGLAV